MAIYFLIHYGTRNLTALYVNLSLQFSHNVPVFLSNTKKQQHHNDELIHIRFGIPWLLVQMYYRYQNKSCVTLFGTP